MPYINKKDRWDYFPVIESVLQHVPLADPLAQAEYIGYFLAGVARGFERLSLYSPAANPFAWLCEDEEVKSAMDTEVSAALELLHSKSPIERVGDFNYLCSAIVWGYLGDSTLFNTANYATRCYMRGLLRVILEQVEQEHPLRPEQLRSHILLRSVVCDIMDELYRRKTGIYEDTKIEQNGDIWPLRVETVDVETLRRNAATRARDRGNFVNPISLKEKQGG